MRHTYMHPFKLFNCIKGTCNTLPTLHCGQDQNTVSGTKSETCTGVLVGYRTTDKQLGENNGRHHD